MEKFSVHAENFSVYTEGFSICTENHSVEFFLSPSPESLQHLCCRVAEQRERKLVLLLKADMRGGRVLADSEDLIPACEEGVIVVADVARLGCASGCRVFRIKVNDSFFAEKVLVCDRPSLLVLRAEMRHLVSGL